jgi:hypothetical protein
VEEKVAVGVVGGRPSRILEAGRLAVAHLKQVSYMKMYLRKILHLTSDLKHMVV